MTKFEYSIRLILQEQQQASLKVVRKYAECLTAYVLLVTCLDTQTLISQITERRFVKVGLVLISKV